ncbi:hypothetical protein RUND412_005164 [Rhizina undulata]
MPAGPFVSSADFITNFFDTVVQPNPGWTMFAIIDKTSSPKGAMAGAVALMNTSTANRNTEIGYRTHVTSNAVGLLLFYCLDTPAAGGLGLRRVTWQTSSANPASMWTAERLGFVKEGVLRWDRVFEGGVGNGNVGPEVGGLEGEGDLGRDTVVYGQCWDDWNNGGRERMLKIMDRRA